MTGARKWDEVSNGDLEAALAVVEHGIGKRDDAGKLKHDPDTARNLIEYFWERMRDGECYDDGVLFRLMKHAFGKIIEDGWSADEALGLKLRKGMHPREDVRDRDIAVTAFIVLQKRKAGNGYSHREILENAANLFFENDGGNSNAGIKSAGAAFTKFRETFERFPDDVLRRLLPPGVERYL